MIKFKLAASIVCADMLDVRREVQRIEDGGADLIHFDVMDGAFVPRFGLHPEMLAAIRSTTHIPIDVHLMVNYPIGYIKDFVDAGASYMTIHVEATDHIHRALSIVKGLGVKAGIALNPGTCLNVIDEVINDIDLILLMAINPGIVGHKLIPNAIDKIHRCRKIVDKSNRNIPIMVDGGVTYESAPEMVESGAEILVCGSSTIFRPETTVDEKLIHFRNHLDANIG